MIRLWQGAFFALLVLSTYYFFRALHHIAPDRNRIAWQNLRPNLLWHRDAFIGPGRRYRNLALMFLAGAGVLMILGALVG